VRTARLWIAMLAPLPGAVVMRAWENHPPAALWIPAILLAISGLLAQHGQVGSQLIARSIWWANLVLGTLISIAGGSHEKPLGLVLALATGTALLAMGRMGLDEDERSAFKPVAFRTSLTLSMIMAVADAQALVLFGALRLEDAGSPWGGHRALLEGGLLLVSAAVVALAIAGLYRLRAWGLLLGTLSAAGVAVLALTDAYGIKGPVANALILTSAVQILLPLPVFVAIVRRRSPAPSLAPSRLGRVVPGVLVVLMMGVSVAVVGLRLHY
jgi:hypothetical protein